MTTTLNDAGAQANWVVREGCTWSRQFTATINGTAVNITSYTITAEVTSAPTSDAALKTFTEPDAAAGKFRISVAAASADLTPGTYFWALQWNDGTDDLALCSGNFIVKDWTL
jgi:hypothetical protein